MKILYNKVWKVFVMILESFVKPLPDFLAPLPYFNRIKGITVIGRIYLKKPVYENLCLENPAPENIGVLIHERTHLTRIKKIGLLRFGFISGAFLATKPKKS